eukprot:CAMPEP_0184239942 /NCGR_PEP_ID=MMETSP0976-20121227/27639_1 /TAXON_ID=483370 /ORGANISM="non described non described, Strain CCMP2097" /LENGTH=121 /DNA_ID=CAMNT_0026545161 /DNA_START=2015 /DNA_END=2380 /DNA_ORIENTATION=+
MVLVAEPRHKVLVTRPCRWDLLAEPCHSGLTKVLVAGAVYKPERPQRRAAKRPVAVLDDLNGPRQARAVRRRSHAVLDVPIRYSSVLDGLLRSETVRDGPKQFDSVRGGPDSGPLRTKTVL